MRHSLNERRPLHIERPLLVEMRPLVIAMRPPLIKMRPSVIKRRPLLIERTPLHIERRLLLIEMRTLLIEMRTLLIKMSTLPTKTLESHIIVGVPSTQPRNLMSVCSSRAPLSMGGDPRRQPAKRGATECREMPRVSVCSDYSILAGVRL